MLQRYLEFAIGSSIDIDAPPDKVWQFIADIDNFPNVFWNVTSVERLDGNKAGSPIEVGSSYRIHRQTEQGERYFGDWTVTALEPGRSVTFYSPNVVSDGMISTTTWSVAPACHEYEGDTVHEQEGESNGMNKTKKSACTSGSSQGRTERRGSRTVRTNEFVQRRISWGSSAVKGKAKKGGTKEDPTKSVASITLAIMPTKLFLVAGRVLCCCFYKKRALSVTEKDLEDLAFAVVKASADQSQWGP